MGEELDNYYGVLTEISMGVVSPIPDKPQALILYETCKAMGLPLWDGGVMDQPDIWVLEYGICDRKFKFYQNQNKLASAVPPSGDSPPMLPE